MCVFVCVVELLASTKRLSETSEKLLESLARCARCGDRRMRKKGRASRYKERKNSSNVVI